MASAATRDVLITAQPQAEAQGPPLHLEHVEREATAIQNAFGNVRAEKASRVGVGTLGELLRGSALPPGRPHY